MDTTTVAKYFIYFGLFLLLSGGVLLFLSRVGISVGKLPFDIVIQKDNFTFYFPLATCIIISIVLTILLNLILKK